MGRVRLTFDELNTLLVEIESVINSRPFTYIYDDTEWVTYPLTPSQLFYDRNVTLSPNDSYLGTLCIQQQRVEVFLEEDRIHSQMFDQGSLSADFCELEECCSVYLTKYRSAFPVNVSVGR